MIRNLALSLLLLPGFLFAECEVINDLIAAMREIPKCKTKQELVGHYVSLVESKMHEQEQKILQELRFTMDDLLTHTETVNDRLRSPRSWIEPIPSDKSWVKKRIATQFNDFGAKIVGISHWKGAGNAMVAGFKEGQYVAFDMDYYGQKPIQVFDAVIGHEAQHAIYEDYIPVNAWTHMASHNTWSLLPLSQLMESRADIFACLQAPYYAEGTLLEWQNRLAAHDHVDCGSWTHPSFTQRVEMAQIVLGQLQQLPESEQTKPITPAMRKSWKKTLRDYKNYLRYKILRVARTLKETIAQRWAAFRNKGVVTEKCDCCVA